MEKTVYRDPNRAPRPKKRRPLAENLTCFGE